MTGFDTGDRVVSTTGPACGTGTVIRPPVRQRSLTWVDVQWPGQAYARRHLATGLELAAPEPSGAGRRTR